MTRIEIEPVLIHDRKKFTVDADVTYITSVHELTDLKDGTEFDVFIEKAVDYLGARDHNTLVPLILTLSTPDYGVNAGFGTVQLKQNADNAAYFAELFTKDLIEMRRDPETANRPDVYVSEKLFYAIRSWVARKSDADCVDQVWAIYQEFLRRELNKIPVLVTVVMSVDDDPDGHEMCNVHFYCYDKPYIAEQSGA